MPSERPKENLGPPVEAPSDTDRADEMAARIMADVSNGEAWKIQQVKRRNKRE